MAWKTINGRRYYYKSKRVGDRVETLYFGPESGPGALMAYIDGMKRLEKTIEHFDERDERDELDAEEKTVADWFDDVQTAADAAMVDAGYHKHRGQWRKRRTE